MITVKIKRFKSEREAMDFDFALMDLITEYLHVPVPPGFPCDFKPYGITEDYDSDMDYFMLHVEDHDLAMLIKLTFAGSV